MEGREWPQNVFHDHSSPENVADLLGVKPTTDHHSDMHPTEAPRLGMLGGQFTQNVKPYFLRKIKKKKIRMWPAVFWCFKGKH